MPDAHKEKQGFHIVATEVLDEDNNVQGYSISIPEYPEAEAFCEKPEDIVQTGWEAKEKAAALSREKYGGGERRKTNMSDKEIAAGADKYNGKNLFDEEFLSAALCDTAACQYVLRKLLSVEDLTVKKVVDRVAVKNPQAQGEIVDVSGEDSRGFTWEITVCRTDKVEPLHSRYEFARIVKRLEDNGQGYSDLREMAVVYIGAVDHYGKGENIYTVRSYIKEMDKPVDDGTRIIFANAEADDGSEVAAMMKYFKTADPEDDSHGALSERVRQLKLN